MTNGVPSVDLRAIRSLSDLELHYSNHGLEIGQEIARLQSEHESKLKPGSTYDRTFATHLSDAVFCHAKGDDATAMWWCENAKQRIEYIEWRESMDREDG